MLDFSKLRRVFFIELTLPIIVLRGLECRHGARLASVFRSPELPCSVGELQVPGVLRTKDGKPNLTAPTPRVNGKPDLSGLWQTNFSAGMKSR